MYTPPLSATIRLTDLKSVARLVSGLDPAGPKYLSTLNRIVAELGLGATWSEAQARARATGALVSGHLPGSAAQNPPPSGNPAPFRARLFLDSDGLYTIARTQAAADALVGDGGVQEIVFLADFEAQAWVRDTAMAIDPQGPTSFDVTADIVDRPAGQLIEETFDTAFDFGDDLARADTAPQWVRDHSGPFLLQIDDDLYDDYVEAIRENRVRVAR